MDLGRWKRRYGSGGRRKRGLDEYLHVGTVVWNSWRTCTIALTRNGLLKRTNTQAW